MGGILEQMIRCNKRCLRKTLGNARINYHDLLTILHEIENNRPLTVVYYGEILQALKPNKLFYEHNIKLQIINMKILMKNLRNTLQNVLFT